MSLSSKCHLFLRAPPHSPFAACVCRSVSQAALVVKIKYSTFPSFLLHLTALPPDAVLLNGVKSHRYDGDPNLTMSLESTRTHLVFSGSECQSKP